ncbi:MAG: hypothetical protein HS123_15820 [Solibacteraceae bacterium]|nr:hypothetical protein [Solibacteraceae bacterium]
MDGEIRLFSLIWHLAEDGYTKEPVVHTMSHRPVRRNEGGALAGGVAFAGMRGVQRVEVRAGALPGPKRNSKPAVPYTWTR